MDEGEGSLKDGQDVDRTHIVLRYLFLRIQALELPDALPADMLTFANAHLAQGSAFFHVI